MTKNLKEKYQKEIESNAIAAFPRESQSIELFRETYKFGMIKALELAQNDIDELKIENENLQKIINSLLDCNYKIGKEKYDLEQQLKKMRFDK